MRPLTAAVLGKAVAALVLGAVVGAVGTVMHRWHEPWGVVACLALVLAGAVTARAWSGWPTWVGYAGGVFLAVQMMAQTGPGGDVLVPSGRVVSWVWVIGSIGLALVTGLLPARLFADGPRARGESWEPTQSWPPPAGEEPESSGRHAHPAPPGADADEPGR